ncbi:MAG: helix-turn-helix transcriptional regulator [Clostridia bacterium]|nr:helix-turn-helix transcriptional regulator [Clostridia bacterium]MBQ4131807.1 helix-turn-helix transcriptional regulator [Clostridia bacterium]
MTTRKNANQDKEVRSVLGRNLLELRKAHRLTQDEVAKIIKVKRSTYAYYERDIVPSLENIKRLSRLFDVTVHFLLYGHEEPVYGMPRVLNDPSAITSDIHKLKDVKKDEALVLSYYRLLDKQNKEKLLKELLDLYEKQFL